MGFMRKKMKRIFILIIGICLIVKLTGDIRHLLKASEQVKLTGQRVLELEEEKKRLLEKKEYYQSEEFIEEEARNKLNMAKPGETIVILPPNVGELVGRSQKETFTPLPNWKKWWNLFF